MKRFLLLLLVLPFISCDDSGPNRNNPYIPNVGFSVQINTQLPAYNQLQFPGNGVYVPNYGVRGLIVFYTGATYLAFDAACPNQALSSCSTMEYTGGSTATCPCDDAIYNLYIGDSPGMQYTLYPYRVEVNGTVLRVYN